MMRYIFNKSLKRLLRNIDIVVNVITFICSIIGIIIGAYLFGFRTEASYIEKALKIFNILITIFTIASIRETIISCISTNYNKPLIVKWTFTLLLCSTLLLIIDNKYQLGLFNLSHKFLSIITISMVSIASFGELSHGIIRLMTKIVNPMAIFASSFLILIIIGAAFLSFPNSTYGEGNISIIDALFVSTSATCVTGLCSVPFTETFTLYGQIVVLFLIQIGGLGVVTLTSFFALSLMGALPFNSSLMIRDLISEDNSNSISGLVIRIVSTTLAIEAVGALMIFITTSNNLIGTFADRLYFSVFHSISAFCNAGFTIHQGGLGAPDLINNNFFYYIISFLIIFGGIGFPIYSNIFKIISKKIKNLIRFISKKRVNRNIHQWDLNSSVVIKTTFALLLFGTLYFLVFEWNGMLAGLSIEGKIAQAFFNAVLPRTAGFSSQDISNLAPTTFIVIILLMWIGGAPQSTAGGIKVTTFWMMIRNALCQIKGINRVEMRQREVSQLSTNRAFATVVISLITIAIAYFLLLFTDGGLEPRKLLFEVISALGTVGSSMGVTESLSELGKIIITIVMFIGRIGFITILASFVKQDKYLNYRYPSGHILIN